MSPRAFTRPLTTARARRAGRPQFVLVAGVAAAAAVLGGCSRPGAEDRAAVPPGGVGRASTEPLTQGEYTVQSRARFTGATLRLVDNKSGGYSAQLELPGRQGLYSGIARPSGADSLEMSLSCLCPVGNDGPGGSTRYDQVAYDGHYRVREVDGGRIELRQTDGTAVDTVARR